MPIRSLRARAAGRTVKAMSNRELIERYENQCAAVFTLADGEIVTVREYMDTHYAFGAFNAPVAR